jgi:exopolyphosphatase/guanosine-5'-triphosphate,3'-diphosphate pyrophosphatase
VTLRAGIDIGTNTILLLIAEVTGGKVARVLEDHVRVVRLGQGVDKNRAFRPEAMDRARACFADYSEILKKYPGIELRAVATSGSRDAKNSAEFFSEINARYQIPIRVISGEEEAALSFYGALPDDIRDPAAVAVLDIGGGSTEIVGLGGQGKLVRFSFDMGCVRMNERYLKSDPPIASQIQELRDFVQGQLALQPEIIAALKGKTLIGVAGTATYLASSALNLPKFIPEKVNGSKLTLENISFLIEKFRAVPASARLGVGGMDSGRADVIVAGAIILQEFLRAAAYSELRISTRGLRYGAVLDLTR